MAAHSDIRRTDMLRVLELGNPSGLYGAERWILALIHHLPKDRVQLWVGAIRDVPGAEVPLCTRAAKLGFDTVVFDAQGRISLPAVGLIRQFILRHDVDIIHTHGYKSSLIGLLAARGTQARCVATPHGWSVDAGIKLRFYELLERASYAFMDAVVPLSQGLFEGLNSKWWLRKKLHLIRNGVDLDELGTGEEVPKCLADWKDEGKPIVGYIGQLIPRKDVATLFRAVRRLHSWNTVLCVIGDGPDRTSLEALAGDLSIADRVRFLGYRADRIDFLRLFDVFVLPSRLEGIPRCLMEAMAVGVPVVASDIPGCTPLVTPGNTGWLFPPGDDAVLAQRISTVLGDTLERDRILQQAKQYVQRHHSARAMADGYLEVYAHVLGKGMTRHA